MELVVICKSGIDFRNVVFIFGMILVMFKYVG